MVVLGLNFSKPFCCVLDRNEVVDPLEIGFGANMYQDRQTWRLETAVFYAGHPRGPRSGRRLKTGEADEPNDVVLIK